MNRRFRSHLFLMTVVAVVLLSPVAVNALEGAEPTLVDVAYGPDEQNRLDFWKAPSDTPTPVIVHIHGGGFHEGDKSGFRRHEADNIVRCLAMGVSLASIDYRFIDAAPLQDILRDSARAIQFLRFNAESWNIDKARIASFGDSAGAGTSLWLAFHDDLADPGNPDPVLRESSRLIAAGALSPQASYDFGQWPAILGIPQMVWPISTWYVSPKYYHFSGLGSFMQKGLKVRSDLDMLSLIDSNDPPVYLLANQEDTDLTWTNLARLSFRWTAGKLAGKKISDDSSPNLDILHHPSHARALESACQRLGTSCTAIYRDTPVGQRVDVFDFLLEQVAPQH